MEMRTGEVAKLVSRHPDTIRDYERRGVIRKARRDLAGWRTYSLEDVEAIRKILAGEKEATPAKP